jgi:hypothetical protein
VVQQSQVIKIIWTAHAVLIKQLALVAYVTPKWDLKELHIQKLFSLQQTKLNGSIHLIKLGGRLLKMELNKN